MTTSIVIHERERQTDRQINKARGAAKRKNCPQYPSKLNNRPVSPFNFKDGRRGKRALARRGHKTQLSNGVSVATFVRFLWPCLRVHSQAALAGMCSSLLLGQDGEEEVGYSHIGCERLWWLADINKGFVFLNARSVQAKVCLANLQKQFSFISSTL